MDAVKYRNGREVKVGDKIVGRSLDTQQVWSGVVVEIEQDWGTLAVVPSSVSLLHVNQDMCLHVNDAFAAADAPVPVVKNSKPLDLDPMAKGTESGGTPLPPQPKEPDQVKAPEVAAVKPEPKPGEEGGPAIIAPE